MKIEEANSEKEEWRKEKICPVFRIIGLCELKESSRTKLSRLRFPIDISVEMACFKNQHVISIL
jgi:hypothetical protein